MIDEHTGSAGELGSLIRALRRRWWLVAVCWLLVLGVVTLYSVTATKQYSATAGLLFRDPGFDQKLFGTTFLPPNRDPAREAATNVKLVSLDIVAERTARFFPGLTSAEISGKVTAEQEGDSDVVSVTGTDHDPALARRLANTFAKQYIEFRREADRAKIRQAQELVQSRLERLTPAQRSAAEGRSLVESGDRLEVLASLQTGNAELVQLAQTPTAPSSPKVMRNIVLGAVLGLLVGMSVALLIQRLDRRVREPEDLEEAYRLPVLGLIPRSPALDRTRARPAAVELPPAEAEAFRLLRAHMRYFNVDKELRTVLVTSATSSEGKTTVAINLAAAATSSGTKVLLLEADMRRPTVAQRIGPVPAVGLAEVLTHGAELDDAIRPISVQSGAGASGRSTFDVLTAGATPPNPHELIESRRMSELLDALEAQYDLVIIDTPPVLIVSDAIPLIRRVGGVLVVSRLGVTTRDAARRLAAALDGLDAPVIGVVANGLRRRAGAYYGYESETAYSASTGAPTEAVGPAS